MLDIDNHHKDEMTFSLADANVQRKARDIADAMCLATASAIMQSGSSFNVAFMIVSRMEDHFRNLAALYVTSNSVNPETYVLHAKCNAKLIIGADELERQQRELKREGARYMSFDASLTLEAALLFVNSNNLEDESHALQPKH